MKNSVLIAILLALILFALSIPGHSDERASDAVWLARSCAGEAGLRSYQTGECLAILHIYRKRAAAAGCSIVEMAKRYSAAIKQRGPRHPNRWVLHLQGTGRPKYWPGGSSWKRYRMHWLRLWFQAAMFLQGQTRDPLPTAWHYGAASDPVPAGCKRMETNYKNRFYWCGRKTK